MRGVPGSRLFGRGQSPGPSACQVLALGSWLRAPAANAISHLGNQELKRALRTLMYLSTGVTGRMRNRWGSSILGFGVGASSPCWIS